MLTASEAINRGYRAREEGNLPVARELYAEGARLYRELNDMLACAHALRHLADIHRKEGSLADASPLYEEALEIYRGNLDTKLLDLANTLRPYALLHEKQGNVEAAKKLWEEARNLYSSLRIHEGVSESNAHLARLSSS